MGKGDAKLNSFGSAWGELALTETMPLGEFTIRFPSLDGRTISATLFRLEEYKLPEFKVRVSTPEEDGHKKAFRLGETVEAEVLAEYYFGGPVASAEVEVVVTQSPFFRTWQEPREFPWFYADMQPQQRHWGGGQEIKRETLKTDAEGKAKVRFETPANSGQDLEFRIEARVTDASRREIIGSDSVRVTRQRYAVTMRPAHNLYRPQDKVAVGIKALDANDNPVVAEGRVKVTRDVFIEVWLAPDGREMRGDELAQARGKTRIFPPPAEPGWRLKFRGYEHDDILTRTLKTDAEGQAELTFTPERDGFYRVTWESADEGGLPVRAETCVWVATNATTELGYRSGGVEIIVDKDTFRAGRTAPVMLTAPTNDRYVLFSVEGNDLYSYQLVHLTGTAKLIELPIEEKHVPTVFLNAAMVSDAQIFTAMQQVVVPPVEHFLAVSVKADREQYQPGEEGTLTITARDHDGKPVAGEVAFGLVDESVFYIQQDYAGDPRQFFYGTKRQQTVRTESSFQQKSYARLVEREGNLIDERQVANITPQIASEGREEFNDGDRFGGKMLEREELKHDQVPGFAKGAGGQMAQPAAAAMPRPSKTPMSRNAPMQKVERPNEAAGDEAPASEPAVVVRSDFRSTVLWQPDVKTDADGTATVKVTYPDSLTTWKATARAATEANQFGIGEATMRTKKPLIVRLQAPRFFVVGDTVTISAVINNNTDAAIGVTPKLEAEGLSLYPQAGPRPIQVAAGGEARVDWQADVKKAGSVKLNVTARAGSQTDAMEKSYVAYEHGIEKFVAKSGKVRGEDVTVKLDIPRERKPGSATLTVQVAPSMAVTMLDALPYLARYPYGCTEQTMSRFLPAAIVRKTLSDLGLDGDAVMKKHFGGIEVKHADKTHAGEKRNLAELDDMVKAGLQRLYDYQHADGGWGWWKSDDSDHYMSAYVVWGLALAQDAEVGIDRGRLQRGIDYLDREIVEEELAPDMQAWMLHALAVASGGKPTKFQQTAFDNLWKNRDQLNAYTRALLALSAHHFGLAEKAKTLVENLENGVKRDETPDTSVVMRGAQKSYPAVIATAHWGQDGIFRRWSDGGIEGTAFALRALLAIDPKNALIEPVTNWLVKNRRGAQWSNTRDTAITVLALNDYLRMSGELKPDIEYELLVNDKSVAKKKLSGEDALAAPSRFEIDPALIRDGENDIRIRRLDGEGAIYFAAEAEFFSLEEPVTPAGSEIFVRRQYYKLVPRETLLKGHVLDRQPLEDGGTVASGERVETVLTIEGKNDYEYLLFEDLKPAGFEAVEVRSGEPLQARELKSGAVKARDLDEAKSAEDYTGRETFVYQELRDRKVALFVRKLPEGVWEIRYDLRAEVPGKFHALPVVGHAMYVPEIRCNGAEVRVEVVDR